MEKTSVEIEKLAENSSELQEATYTPQHKITYQHGYIDGYTQCQEDMADRKYTEEAMLFAFVHGGTKFEENKDASILHKNFKELINSLNKQD